MIVVLVVVRIDAEGLEPGVEEVPDVQRVILDEHPLGIGFAELSAPEQDTLKKLVELHARRLRNDLANRDLARIAEKGWDKVSFAWAGSEKPGEGHYYRVQGPTFIIEYDNTQNNANHVHVIWRDRENEFGGDLLKAHYEQTPHPLSRSGRMPAWIGVQYLNPRSAMA